MNDTDPRVELIRGWLRDELQWPLRDLRLASADASFRRYFRIWDAAGATRIVMDAPPDREDIGPYLQVSGLLADCGVHVPLIDAADTDRGLVLLEDLGSTHMLAELQNGGDVDALYQQALLSLTDIQLRGAAAAALLPRYDATVLMREMLLMPEWFCARHLQLPAAAAHPPVLQQTLQFLVGEILQQPVVLVHRDYHSRNLMITGERSPGIIDFQDALAGPVGYDLASLLKDCYIAWPRAQAEDWVLGHYRRLQQRGATLGADPREFLRWFDLVGLQRHIKVLGIFARLWYRDGKRGYLADLPRTLEYVRDTAGRYSELAAFSTWVEQQLVPALPLANQRALAPVALAAALS